MVVSAKPRQSANTTLFLTLPLCVSWLLLSTSAAVEAVVVAKAWQHPEDRQGRGNRQRGNRVAVDEQWLS